MNDKPSRFGWLAAMLFFCLWVLVLKLFKVLVCVFALKDLAIQSTDGFASWVDNASASNPFLTYLEQLVFVVLCLALLCMALAIRLFLKQNRSDNGTKISA